MPIYGSSRDAFVAAIAQRQRWMGFKTRLKRGLGARKPFQAAVYDATFRSDAEAVRYFYAVKNNHLPDLGRPVWLNEKIRWQFLNHPNPLMSLAADKIAVRAYLRLKRAAVGAPELYASGTDPAELPRRLPKRFVMKSAYGSGQMHIETGAGTPRGRLVEKAARWTEHDQWRQTGELHYRTVPKRWLIEEFVPSSFRKLDIKVFCILGAPVFIAAITERGLNGVKHVLLDPDWRRVGFGTRGIETDPRPVPRPDDLELILDEARRLSEDFLHVRVDFLKFDDRLVFSELTFASLAARVPHEPAEVNATLGALMDLDAAPRYLARGRRIAAELGWSESADPVLGPEAGPRPEGRLNGSHDTRHWRARNA